jgi:hypothetical protein
MYNMKNRHAPVVVQQGQAGGSPGGPGDYLAR